MKKLIVATGITLAIALASCHTNESHDPAQDTVTNRSMEDLKNNARAATDDPALHAGAVLVANGDCQTCHQIETKTTGPSFVDIANKYENTEPNVDELAYKIVKGGSGRWGTVEMPAHPQVSIENARAMSRYVLSLRNK